MIYAEDGNLFSWDPVDIKYPDPMFSFYGFLSALPLYAKKDLFQSISGVLSNHSLSDVFVTSSQMRWAVGVIRLGLQLPIEDLGIIENAFKQYSDIIFILHRLEFRDTALEAFDEPALADYAALEVLTRPSILFNPRPFFESDMPEQMVNGADDSPQSHQQDGPASYPNSPIFDSNGQSGNGVEQTARLRGVASATTISKKQSIEQARSGKPANLQSGTRPALKPARMKRALELWEKYVSFLAHVLRVYSTMMRGLQTLMSGDVLISIFRSTISVIDMILSQGGTNPRLIAWRDRYRDVIGAELWDKTWATIGDRLETPAIKLLLDVWGRLINQHKIADDKLLTNVCYWFHRDELVDACMLLMNQISKRVLRAHYPHDKSIGIEKLRVHYANFSMTTTTTDTDAKYMMLAFARTPLDFNQLSGHGYYAYASEMCNSIERMLSINRVIIVNGVQYAQAPPTANYILYLYGSLLFSMAMRDYIPSREYIKAKRRVITLLTRLMTMCECSHDKLLPSNRIRILQAIDQAISKYYEAQAILPNVPTLLKNSAYVRPFIPKLFDLVCHVLPKEHHTTLILDECALRYYAYEAMSALIAYVGYYHNLGRSDLIATTDTQLRKHLDSQIPEIAKHTQSMRLRQALERLKRRVDSCVFKKSAKDDVIFARYLRFIFQTLMLSVATENDLDNIQYATCIILTFLYQYSRYCPGYVEAFVEFYVDQLQSTKSDQMASVYTYGLMQTAMVTWTNALSRSRIRRIVSTVVDALSSCDKSLHRYSHWNPYHQLFISSLRCLISWVSVLSDSELLDPFALNKLVALLTRCNNFISSARPQSNNSKPKQGLRLQPVTSILEQSTVGDSTDPLGRTHEYSRVASVSGEKLTEPISSLTMFGIFGKSAKIALPTFAEDSSGGKLYTLSQSLYQALYTTTAVFSSTILRGMDTMQFYAKHTPADVYATRQAINYKPLPEISVILKECSPHITSMLEGYVPTSIRFFSVFYRAVYTVINFKRYENGRWSDSVVFTTSRYAGGSKQWLAFPSKPKGLCSGSAEKPNRTDTAYDEVDEDESLPWIRLGTDILYPDSIKKKLRFSDAHESLRGTELQIDDASEQIIEGITAEDFKRLHESREAPDILFAPAEPPEQQHRGNTFDRPTSTLFFGIDFSFLEIAEPILRDLDQLDDLDRPFSAHTGVIYLQSPESLSTKRDICKGPLRGTSAEFSHFLDMLNRLHMSPAELIKRQSNVPLLRYVFGIKGFKVCYNLAPNLSSLISGKPMSPEDNLEFYEQLRERGIAVLWFDTHPGFLDTDLAWQFIDRLQNGSGGQSRKHSDDEYLRPAAQPQKTRAGACPGASDRVRSPPSASSLSRASSTQPDTVAPLHDKPPNRPQSADRHNAKFESPPRSLKKPGLLNRAMHLRHHLHSPDMDSMLSRCSSEPCRILGTNVQNRRLKPTASERGSRISTATGISVSTNVEPPLETPQEAGNHKQHDNGKRPTAQPNSIKESSTESLRTFLASNPQDPSNDRKKPEGDKPGNSEQRATGSGSRVRILIALAPVVGTRGRLIKIAVSATGGSEKLNREFARMTGPLMSNMVVEAKDIAYILSATVLDASANIASLQGEDFSMVYKRMEMIRNIIRKYGVKHTSIDSVHKFMFPVGTSGVQSTFHVRQ